jgi:hypothetical protein
MTDFDLGGAKAVHLGVRVATEQKLRFSPLYLPDRDLRGRNSPRATAAGLWGAPVAAIGRDRQALHFFKVTPVSCPIAASVVCAAFNPS